MAEQDDILDPAHTDELVVAGIPPKDAPKDDKADDGLVVSEDGNLLERGGVKYMRAEAVHQARNENKQLRETLARLDPVMPEFEQFLEQKNARSRATTSRATAGPDLGDYSQDELDGLAITRGYYKEDGTTPDIARAKQELDIITRVTDRQVKGRMAPLEQMSARDRASVNRERARGAKFVDGQPIADERYLNAALSSLPDEYLADPNIANITQVIAAGLEYLDHRKNGTLPGRSRGAGPVRGREPMFVERGTGRYDGDEGELSSLDLAAARARGKSPEQWAKLSKSANRANAIKTGVLEDL